MGRAPEVASGNDGADREAESTSALTDAVVLGLDDRPPWGPRFALGAQHLLAMLLGNLTPPLLVAKALEMSPAETVFLIQMALVMAGVATLVQCYPLGPVGGRLPVVMGTSIAFLGGILSIAREFNLATVFGACLVAAVVEVILGFAIGGLKRLFPPLVNGIVVMLIGLTLIPVGMDYAAGGVGSPDYGAAANLLVAGLVLVLTLVFNQFGRGFLAYASILLGVVAGYLVALGLGWVDLRPVAEAGWLAVPELLPLGIEFHWGPILVMAFIYVISTMETLGDVSGILAVTGRSPTRRELRGSLVADGVMSGFASLFGAFPNTSFSQNVGLVSFTGVLSRHVTGVTGGLLVVLGLVPKVGAVFASLPAPVIGGAGLILFAMIFASGTAILHRGAELTQRNLVILAVSLSLGLGVELRPAALTALPPQWASFLGSGLVTGGLTALVLNLVLPERRRRPKSGGE